MKEGQSDLHYITDENKRTTHGKKSVYKIMIDKKIVEKGARAVVLLTCRWRQLCVKTSARLMKGKMHEVTCRV